MTTPGNLRYAKTDEWVKVDGNIATIGVSDYAQEALSDVVFFETVISIGDKVTNKTHVATLESVKAAADVNSPVSGTVVAINEDLASSPELVNSDPYDKAWMLKIDLSDPSELNTLLDTAGYEAFCASRSH
jgi:glycine cleavage system H protein